MKQKSLNWLIGQRIQTIRKDAGLTQLELAEKLSGDCHKNTVSDWENGRSNLALGRLNEIGEILGVDPVVFVSFGSDDYRAAMNEAAGAVEQAMRQLVEELRARASNGDAPPPHIGDPDPDTATGKESA